MRVGQANIRSLNTSAEFIACSKQNIEIMCMSEIWHPDNDITEKNQKEMERFG